MAATKRFAKKIAVVTGAMHGIGQAIASRFTDEGATALSIDITPGGYFTGDLAQKDVLERFAEQVIYQYGQIDYLVNNAIPLMKGMCGQRRNCSLNPRSGQLFCRQSAG